MSLESGQKNETAESKQNRCERQIESFLSELDTTYNEQNVNDALDRVLTPAREGLGIPESLEPLNERLDELRSEFGEDTVDAALYEIDKRRNPPAESEPVAEVESSEERTALEDSVKDAVESLNDDTIALIIDEDGAWEIREFAAKFEVDLERNPRDEETLSAMLDILEQIIALQTSEDPDNGDEIEELGEELMAL